MNCTAMRQPQHVSIESGPESNRRRSHPVGDEIKFPGSRMALGALALAGAALIITLGTSVLSARSMSGRQGCSENHCERGTHRMLLLPKAFGDDQRRVLIQDCAQNLTLPESICDPRSPADGNSYEVPYMTSGKLECGFERRMPKEDMERLAMKYDFRFVGASTTRRLAESFVSIYTGKASRHVKVHESQDFSVDKLKVGFEWGPFCAGDLGIGAMIKRAMDKSAESARRLVLVVVVGIHDAHRVGDFQDLSLEVIVNGGDSAALDMYKESRKQGVLARDSLSNASLASCLEVTADLAAISQDGSLRPRRQVQTNHRELRLLRRAQVHNQQNRSNQAHANDKLDLLAAPKMRGNQLVTWDSYSVEMTAQEREGSTATPEASGKGGRGARGDGRRLNQGGRGVVGWGLGQEAGRGFSTTEEKASETPPEIHTKGPLRGEGRGGEEEVKPAVADAGEIGGQQEQRLSAADADEVRDQREKDRSAKVDAEETVLKPLVFVFQGNPYRQSDPRDVWLTELHDLQREILLGGVPATSAEPGGTRGLKRNQRGSGVDGGAARSPSAVYLIQDSVSLFRCMECYRADDIHFLEPVKLVEGKMLWDLLALLDDR